MARTGQRAVYLLLALLFLLIGMSLGVYALSTDETLWMRIVAGVIGAVVLLAGIYEGYTAVRDALFPEKSTLARSIRSQLPYPEEAPEVTRLFAMVDDDIRAHGVWFGQAAIGSEWVLGDEASFIPRIRGIFTKAVTQHHTSNGRTQTSRTLQLILVDDRWQVQVTGFRDERELYAAADCLRLRVPEAAYGNDDAYLEFVSKDEDARTRFEQTFRLRQGQRESQARTVETVQEDFVLRRVDGTNTSRITSAQLCQQLDECAGKSVSFALSPTKPIPVEDAVLDRLECFGGPGGFQLVMVTWCEKPGFGGYSSPVTRQEALNALEALLHKRALPDYREWNPVQRLKPSTYNK